jgi:hypothetical protein
MKVGLLLRTKGKSQAPSEGWTALSKPALPNPIEPEFHFSLYAVRLSR